MMSVIVKGMKMPANCQNCFASDDECRFCRAAKKYIPMLGKPKFCPLVELPDHHGRLGDLDELKTAFPICDNSMDIKIASVRATINHMDTIVKAEREE